MRKLKSEILNALVPALLLLALFPRPAPAQEPRPPASSSPEPETTNPKPQTDLYGDPLPPGAVARLGTVRLRHPSRVFSLAFSPDGTMLASACNYGIVRFWDPGTGEQLRELRYNEFKPVNRIAFSPDGRLLAAVGGHQCATGDQPVVLWDAPSGREVARLHGHRQPVYALAFSPDGGLLATAGGRHSSSPVNLDNIENDLTIHLWDVDAKKECRVLRGHEDMIAAVAFTPDGKMLASAGHDNAIRWWDLNKGEEIGRFNVEGDSACSLVFSPDGKFLASASGVSKGSVTLWNVATGKPCRKLDGGLPLAFSPDGGVLITRDGFRWTLADGSLIGRLDYGGLDTRGCSMAVSPDRRTLAIGHDEFIRLLNMETGKPTLALARHEGRIDSIAFVENGPHVTTRGGDGTVRTWEVGTGIQLTTQPDRNTADDTLVTPPDRRYTAVCSDESMHIREAQGGQDKVVLVGAAKDIASAAFSPGGGEVASGHQDGRIRFWSIESGREIRCIQAHQNVVTLLRYLSSSRFLMSASRRQCGRRNNVYGDNSVRMWNVKTGEMVCEMDHPAPVSEMVVSPDERFLVCSVLDYPKYCSLYVWEVASGREVAELKGLTYAVGHPAFSPDHKAIAAGGDGVRLWDLMTGECIEQFDGSGPVAFSPDGAMLASGAGAGEALVWRLTPPGMRTTRASGFEPCAPLDVWQALGGADMRKTYEAMFALVGHPETALKCFKERLQPVRVSEEQVRRLLDDLGHESYAVREKAFLQLEQLDEVAQRPLAAALASDPALEVRVRIEALLANVGSPLVRDLDGLRRLRAVQVLERIGTEDAVAVLASVASGTPGARETREARAALERLSRRLAADEK